MKSPWLEYHIHPETFLEGRKKLAGYIFWHGAGNHILVRQVSPNKEVRQWLIWHNIKH